MAVVLDCLTACEVEMMSNRFCSIAAFKSVGNVLYIFRASAMMMG